MTKRRINAAVILALYLVFLAWYDGWGMSPLTAAEVEHYLANVSPDSEGVEFLDRMRQLGADDDGKEFFMLNLNRYQYAKDEPNTGVPAAYQAYGAGVIGMIFKNAGHPTYSAEFPGHLLTGDASETYWDEMILVRYRSRRDFISMVTSDAYQEIANHRAEGIANAEVTPSNSIINLATPRLLVLLALLVLGLMTDYLLRRRSA